VIAIKPVITESGISALFNATHTGLEAELAVVALGDVSWAPDNTAAGLQNERERIHVAGGTRVAWNQIHVTALSDSALEYEVREVAFYLEGGTLFAVWSDPQLNSGITGASASSFGMLAHKLPDLNLLIAFDLILDGCPPDSLSVSVPEQNLSLLTAAEYATFAMADIANMRRILEFADRCCKPKCVEGYYK